MKISLFDFETEKTICVPMCHLTDNEIKELKYYSKDSDSYQFTLRCSQLQFFEKSSTWGKLEKQTKKLFKEIIAHDGLYRFVIFDVDLEPISGLKIYEGDNEI